MVNRDSFTIAVDGIDPSKIPQRVLSSGAKLPAIGLGTFGSDSVPADVIADAVLGAISFGYRHVDCAAVYGNEKEIGSKLRVVLDSGLVNRDELWITSKLWNDKHGIADVIPTCQQTLQDLQLDYLDLYLVHWPFPNSHPPGCDGNTRNPDARGFDPGEYLATWRKMEELVDMGLVKHIGTSNMTIPKYESVFPEMTIKPVVEELEMHPHFQQPRMYEYLVGKDIVPIGFSPIGSPGRPARDTTPDDTTPTKDPVIVEIAERLGVHPAIVCIKWAIQRGQVPIPFSVNHYKQNIAGALSEPLSDTDMAKIAATDKNCRLIKGVVFLWGDHDDWRALWDPDGTIVE
ncbi:MAG: aldo/keto reductase [Promethearchaeota archaeon]